MHGLAENGLGNFYVDVYFLCVPAVVLSQETTNMTSYIDDPALQHFLCNICMKVLKDYHLTFVTSASLPG